MSLSATSIKRPVLTIVMSIVVIIFGGIGFTSLPVREYPSVDPPIINVRTSYPGANAEIIDSQITEILEASISGISGIRTLTSTSSDGSSSITVEFELGVDMEGAANDVRDRVSRVQYRLPRDCDPPTVFKSDADANPIIMLAVRSDRREPLDLSDVADRLFKERIQTISGVSAGIHRADVNDGGVDARKLTHRQRCEANYPEDNYCNRHDDGQYRAFNTCGG